MRRGDRIGTTRRQDGDPVQNRDPQIPSGPAAIAHDLRNALNVIEFSVACLLNGGNPDGSTVERFLRATLRSARHAQRLVHDLLDTPLGERPSFHVRPSWVPARQLLVEARTIGEPLALQASLTLTVESGRDLPLVWADVDRIGEVFGNLIGNAGKFAPAGGRITVSADADGDTLQFSVVDTGPGFRNDGQGQGPQGPVLAHSEPGLGLAICHEIVGAHGGDIWIEERASGGAVSFSLLTHRSSRT